MSRAARSIFLFGLYIAILGLLLTVVPALVIGPFGFEEPREPWIRVLGVVVFGLGCYYVQAGRQNVTPFFRWTVWGHCLVLVGFTALVVAGLVNPALIIFGVIDAAGAGWTALELRRSKEA